MSIIPCFSQLYIFPLLGGSVGLFFVCLFIHLFIYLFIYQQNEKATKKQVAERLRAARSLDPKMLLCCPICSDSLTGATYLVSWRKHGRVEMHDGKDHHIMVSNRYMDHLAVKHGIRTDDLLYSHLPEVATLGFIRNLPRRLLWMGQDFLLEIAEPGSPLRVGIQQGRTRAVLRLVISALMDSLVKILVSL